VTHDHLFDALQTLERTLSQGDTMRAEQQLAEVLASFAATPHPEADARLWPVYQRCMMLAVALKDDFARALQGNATSNRAAQAYEREVVP
jgi:hypothetical protein